MIKPINGMAIRSLSVSSLFLGEHNVTGAEEEEAAAAATTRRMMVTMLMMMMRIKKSCIYFLLHINEISEITLIHFLTSRQSSNFDDVFVAVV